MRSYKIFHKIITITLATVTLLSAGNINFTSHYGARTVALNGLYFAGRDGTTNLFNNPAMLIYNAGKSLELTMIDQTGQQVWDSPVRALYKNYRADDFALGFGGIWGISSNLSLALSYLRQINYAVDWPYAMLRTSGSNAVVMTMDLYNRIQLNTLAIGAAYKFRTWSVGGAVHVNYLVNKMAFPLANEAWIDLPATQAAYQFHYDQSAWCPSFSIGLNWEILKNLRLGATLRTDISTSIKGDAKSDMLIDLARFDTTWTEPWPPSTTSISSKLELPLMIGAGLLYQINDVLMVNVDASISIWDALQKQLMVDYSSDDWSESPILSRTDTVTGFQANTFYFPHKNSLDFGIGLDYKSDLGIDMRFGYRFSQSPNVPLSYSQFFPGVDQHILSLGIGMERKEYILNVTVAYAIGAEKQITKSANPNWYGRYDSDTLIPALTLMYKL